MLGRVEHPEYFKEGALEHIFKGNTSGGFHYEGLSDANGKVVKIVTPPNEQGIYRAIVEIDGKVKAAPSTFFPKNWTPEEVADAIEEAYNNRVWDRKNVYVSTISSGITIEIYLDSMNRIISAYPLM